MKKFSLTVLLLSCVLHSFATADDSIAILAKKARTPREAYVLYRSAASKASAKSMQEGLHYAKLGYNTVKNSGNDTVVADALDFLAQNLLDVSNYDSAYYYLNLCVQKCQQTGNAKELGKAYVNMMSGYLEIHNMPKAKEYNAKALEVFTRLGNKRGIVKCLIGSGEIYMTAGQSDSSIKYFLQALKVNDTAAKETTVLLYNNIGAEYEDMAMYDTALKYTRLSRDLAARIGDSVDIAGATESIGSIYVHLKKYDSAETSLNSSIIMAQKVKMPSITLSAYRSLGNLYTASGKPKLALEWMNRYHDMKDSLFNKDNEAHIAELEEKYQAKEKEEMIATQDAEIKRNRLTFYFITVMAVLIAIAASIFFLIQRRFRALNRVLIQQKEEITSEKEKSEQLNNVKDKIFSIISHDLRSPLHSIDAALTLLRKKEIAREDFDIMTRRLDDSVQATTNLIENLLAWSRSQLEGMSLNPSAVNMHELIQEALSIHRYAASNKNISLESGTDNNTVCFADINVVRLVMRNLLDNAIKFSNPGSVIMLLSKKEENRVLFIVSDHGIGMNEDQLKNLFTIRKGITKSAGTSREQGSGLGLALCYELIQKSGGSIEVESKKGNGTTVYVNLPAVLNA